MFESAEIGHKLGKKEYQREVPALRAALQLPSLAAAYTEGLDRAKAPLC